MPDQKDTQSQKKAAPGTKGSSATSGAKSGGSTGKKGGNTSSGRSTKS